MIGDLKSRKRNYRIEIVEELQDKGMQADTGFESTINEIEAQEDDLKGYISYIRSLKIESVKPEEAVFCGAGDSFACAKFSERLMNFKPRAFDPYDVILYPEVVRDKKVFFISVSGKTKSNILAAKAAKRRGARETIAITANPESELATCCSDTIELKFTKSEGLTPGTNSFTCSLLACGMLFKNPPRFDVKEMIANAKAWAAGVSDSPHSAYHFVGSGSFYALGIYGAAKIFEFAGGTADYQLTEEFSHMNLFSLQRGQADKVIILRFGLNDERATSLDAYLNANGIESLLIPIQAEKEHVLGRAVSYSIALQYLALNVARNRGLQRPAFLLDQERLEISNKMIY